MVRWKMWAIGGSAMVKIWSRERRGFRSQRMAKRARGFPGGSRWMIQNWYCSQVPGRDMNSQHIKRALAFEANAIVGIGKASQFDTVQVFLIQGRALGG